MNDRTQISAGTRFQTTISSRILHEALRPAWKAMDAGDGKRAVICQIYLPADEAETRVTIQGVLLPSDMEDEARALIHKALEADRK